MKAIQRAQTTAHMQIEEAEATARIRNAYSAIIVSNAQSLYGLFLDQERRNILERALQDKDTDHSMLLRGLFIQINGIFESFIRSLCTVVITKKSEVAGSYSALEDVIRKEHIYRSAKVLVHIKSGHVRGKNYDFDSLQNSLANCILDKDTFNIQADVFTLLMGNCTTLRLAKLFESLSLTDPFGDSIGAHTGLRKCSKERSPRKVAKYAKNTLDNYISLRNEITHGNSTRTMSMTEFESAAKFFKELIAALSEKAALELEAS